MKHLVKAISPQAFFSLAFCTEKHFLYVSLLQCFHKRRYVDTTCENPYTQIYTEKLEWRPWTGK